jgi:hypothetical protein
VGPQDTVMGLGDLWGLQGTMRGRRASWEALGTVEGCGCAKRAAGIAFDLGWHGWPQRAASGHKEPDFYVVSWLYWYLGVCN